MIIPRGYWIVVQRHCKDRTSLGDIIRSGLKETEAKHYAKMFSKHPDYFVWAMHKNDY